jgi:hypothetical protein
MRRPNLPERIVLATLTFLPLAIACDTQKGQAGDAGAGPIVVAPASPPASVAPMAATTPAPSSAPPAHTIPAHHADGGGPAVAGDGAAPRGLIPGMPTTLPAFPSVFPSAFPTALPSGFPTALPSGFPTALPSGFPTAFPTAPPSAQTPK